MVRDLDSKTLYERFHESTRQAYIDVGIASPVPYPSSTPSRLRPLQGTCILPWASGNMDKPIVRVGGLCDVVCFIAICMVY